MAEPHVTAVTASEAVKMAQQRRCDERTGIEPHFFFAEDQASPSPAVRCVHCDRTLGRILGERFKVGELRG
jgi:hypothetical protein